MRTLLAVLLAVLLAAPVVAAVRLEFHKTDTILREGKEPTVQEYSSVVVIDGDRGRFEGPGRTAIIDLGQDKFIFIPDEGEVYQVGHLPFSVFDYVDEDTLPRARVLFEASKGIAEIEILDERKKIGSWQAQRVRIEATAPLTGSYAVFDLWLSTAPLPETEVYDTYSRIQFAYNQFMSSFAEELLMLDGIAVEQKVEFRYPGVKIVNETRLVSAEEVTVTESDFQPPEGYVEEPLDFTSRYKITKLESR